MREFNNYILVMSLTDLGLHVGKVRSEDICEAMTGSHQLVWAHKKIVEYRQ